MSLFAWIIHCVIHISLSLCLEIYILHTLAINKIHQWNIHDSLTSLRSVNDCRHHRWKRALKCAFRSLIWGHIQMQIRSLTCRWHSSAANICWDLLDIWPDRLLEIYWLRFASSNGTAPSLTHSLVIALSSGTHAFVLTLPLLLLLLLLLFSSCWAINFLLVTSWNITPIVDCNNLTTYPITSDDVVVT